jgi:hypothetical protein
MKVYAIVAILLTSLLASASTAQQGTGTVTMPAGVFEDFVKFYKSALGELTSIKTNTGATSTKLDAANTHLASIATSNGLTNTKLDSIHHDLVGVQKTLADILATLKAPSTSPKSPLFVLTSAMIGKDFATYGESCQGGGDCAQKTAQAFCQKVGGTAIHWQGAQRHGASGPTGGGHSPLIPGHPALWGLDVVICRLA